MAAARRCGLLHAGPSPAASRPSARSPRRGSGGPVVRFFLRDGRGRAFDRVERKTQSDRAVAGDEVEALASERPRRDCASASPSLASGSTKPASVARPRSSRRASLRRSSRVAEVGAERIDADRQARLFAQLMPRVLERREDKRPRRRRAARRARSIEAPRVGDRRRPARGRAAGSSRAARRRAAR